MQKVPRERRGGSCHPAAELTQLVTAGTAHLCWWVWEGEKTRAWEEAEEEWVGKTHAGRAVHSQKGLIPARLTVLHPSLHLQKLQKTQVDYVNADTQWRVICTGAAGGSFHNDMSTAIRVGPTGARLWHVHGGCSLPTGFLPKTRAQGALKWQDIFCQGSSFVFFFLMKKKS